MSPEMKEADMRHSMKLRNAVLRKVLPPENRSISSVSKEYGISFQTIQRWMSLAKDGTLSTDDPSVPPNRKPLGDKFEYVLESSRLPEDRKGEWMRQNGIHEEHLVLWEQEIRNEMTKKDDSKVIEISTLKKRNKELERELTRKEKALAEMAALLALKKKLESIFPDDEDD